MNVSQFTLLTMKLITKVTISIVTEERLDIPYAQLRGGFQYP